MQIQLFIMHTFRQVPFVLWEPLLQRPIKSENACLQYKPLIFDAFKQVAGGEKEMKLLSKVIQADSVNEASLKIHKLRYTRPVY